jgi:hypothetical protein
VLELRPQGSLRKGLKNGPPAVAWQQTSIYLLHRLRQTLPCTGSTMTLEPFGTDESLLKMPPSKQQKDLGFPNRPNSAASPGLASL